MTMRPKLENDVPRFVEQSHGQTAGWLGQAFDPMAIDADPSRDDYRVGNFDLLGGLSVQRLDDRRHLLDTLEVAQRALKNWNARKPCPIIIPVRSSCCIHRSHGMPLISQEPDALRVPLTMDVDHMGNRCCKLGD